LKNPPVEEEKTQLESPTKNIEEFKGPNNEKENVMK
jgi:hypothetical protein